MIIAQPRRQLVRHHACDSWSAHAEKPMLKGERMVTGQSPAARLVNGHSAVS